MYKRQTQKLYKQENQGEQDAAQPETSDTDENTVDAEFEEVKEDEK